MSLASLQALGMGMEAMFPKPHGVTPERPIQKPDVNTSELSDAWTPKRAASQSILEELYEVLLELPRKDSIEASLESIPRAALYSTLEELYEAL